MYAAHLRVWFRYFPRSSFLLLKSDDYFDNRSTAASMQRVLQFLDLPQPPAADWVRMLATATTPKSHVAGRQMLPEAREMLVAFYQHHNQDLGRLLGDEGVVRSWGRRG